MPDNFDRMLDGTLPLSDLVSSARLEELQLAARRIREARWAMPAGEVVFPDIHCTVDDFNALVENRCFLKLMTTARRTVYDTKMNLGFGGDIRSNILVEGLAMIFGIFDDIEREMFKEDDESEPERPSREESQ